MNLAVLLALLVALSQQDGGPAPPRDGGTTADVREGGRTDGGEGGDPADGGPDGGADADSEVVRHLDEIENLELLQNLDLFDTKAEPDRKP